MKKLIIAVMITATFVGFLQAQSNADMRDKFSIGVRVGGNLSNVYDEQGDNFVADAKLGFVAGGFLSIPIGSFLGVQPGAYYSQKGFEGSGNILGSPYAFNRTSSFLDIPILLEIKPISFLTIVAGPQYSYLLRQKDEFETNLGTVEQEQEFENDDIRKNIFGLTGGVDINVNNFVIGARAAWDVQRNGDDGSDTPRYKNVLYQATLGLRF